MDRDNYELLSELCPTGYEERLHMIMDFAPELKIPEVPDPYYGGANGFERVFDMIEAAAHGLLEDIRKRHLD